MASFFNCDLATIPTSLFRDNGLRKTDKSQLAKALKSSIELVTLNTQAKYIIEGGTLVHKVKWIKKTFEEIVKQYLKYVHM